MISLVQLLAGRNAAKLLVPHAVTFRREWNKELKTWGDGQTRPSLTVAIRREKFIAAKMDFNVDTLFSRWYSINSRCYNPRDANYATYGARGIRVSIRWRGSFLQFCIDMGNCPEGYTIDRLNNDGDYCHTNCRWKTYTEQAFNTVRKPILLPKDCIGVGPIILKV